MPVKGNYPERIETIQTEGFLDLFNQHAPHESDDPAPAPEQQGESTPEFK